MGHADSSPRGVWGEESVAPKRATKFTGTFFSKDFILWVACRFFKNLRTVETCQIAVNDCNGDLSPILPTGSDGCVYNSVPVQLKVQIVCYERVRTGLSITVPGVRRIAPFMTKAASVA